MSLDFNNAGGGNRGDQVRHLYADLSAFEALLEDAAAEALPGKQEDFVADMQEKFDQYRGQMFLSAAQHSWLKSIAGYE
jgi:hypothetical protein